MSGGSFNYLYIAYNLDAMVDKRVHLIEMHRAIKVLDETEFPGAALAANETQKLIDALSDAEMAVANASMQLRDVWHAVEWWHSNDYGPDQVAEELSEFVKYKE